MITAMYLRKSRAEENEPLETTLSSHREQLTKLAQKSNLKIVEIYQEVVSGDSLFSRPEMLKLLDSIHKYEAIICMDIDRLGRGTMRDQGVIFDTLKLANVKIITPDKSYDLSNDMDDSLISFKALFAREEYKLIKARLHRGIMKSVNDGGFVSTAPYGYEKVRINKKPSLAIVEHQATVVRLIYELYCEGKGYNAIANTLNTAGYTTAKSNKFSPSTIRNILLNPVYTGKIVYNRQSTKHNGITSRHYNPRDKWIVVDGLHPAIIPFDLFDKVNSMITVNYHPPCTKRAIKNPFAGILYCKQCGKIMTRVQSHDTKKNLFILSCRTVNCSHSASLELVEDIFITGLETVLRDIKASMTITVKPNEDIYALEQKAKAELTTLKSQLENLYTLLERGLYDIDLFLERRESIQAQIKANESLKFERQPEPKEIILNLESVLKSYWDYSPADKNAILKTIVSRATYFNPKSTGSKSSPSIEITHWRD